MSYKDVGGGTSSSSGDATTIQSVPVASTGPSDGQVLKYSGGTWAPGADATAEGGFPPDYASLTGSTFTGPVHAQVTGSLTRTSAGTPFITAPAGNSISVSTGSNGQIVLSGSGGAGGGSGAPTTAQYFVAAPDGSLPNALVLSGDEGIKLLDLTGEYGISINDRVVATLSGSTFDGRVTLASEYGATGSITRLVSGAPFITAPAGNVVTVTTGSGGQIVISGSGGSAGGSGAPTDAQYVVLAVNGSLSAERVLTAGTGLSLTDAGANGNATLAISNGVVATVSGTVFTGQISGSALTVSAPPAGGLIASARVAVHQTFDYLTSSVTTSATPRDVFLYNKAGGSRTYGANFLITAQSTTTTGSYFASWHGHFIQSGSVWSAVQTSKNAESRNGTTLGSNLYTTGGSILLAVTGTAETYNWCVSGRVQESD